MVGRAKSMKSVLQMSMSDAWLFTFSRSGIIDGTLKLLDSIWNAKLIRSRRRVPGP